MSIFMQWCWDNLQALRTQQTLDARTCRTTKGNYVIPIAKAGGVGGTTGMVYKGTYLPGSSYSVNDVVRVRTGAYPLGIWICVKDNPVNPTTLINVPPQYPEPFDSSGGATANTWELIALGVKLYTGCKGGVTKQVYIQLMEV